MKLNSFFLLILTSKILLGDIQVTVGTAYLNEIFVAQHNPTIVTNSQHSLGVGYNELVLNRIGYQVDANVSERTFDHYFTGIPEDILHYKYSEISLIIDANLNLVLAKNISFLLGPSFYTTQIHSLDKFDFIDSGYNKTLQGYGLNCALLANIPVVNNVELIMGVNWRNHYVVDIGRSYVHNSSIWLRFGVGFRC